MTEEVKVYLDGILTAIKLLKLNNSTLAANMKLIDGRLDSFEVAFIGLLDKLEREEAAK